MFYFRYRSALERFLLEVVRLITEDKGLKEVALVHYFAAEDQTDLAALIIAKETLRLYPTDANAIRNLSDLEVRTKKQRDRANAGFKQLFHAEHKSMAQMNGLLTNTVIQDAVWKKMKLTCPLPAFNEDMWYGSLSDPSRVPNFSELYVNQADTTVCSFFNDLLKNNMLPENTVIVKFDRMKAAMGRKHRADAIAATYWPLSRTSRRSTGDSGE